ncbi:YmaF family protein [Wukongibacter baidiensis]|uniref:YmaF family protein n=1 Tax=Wukongibacter baidiensis TaxID=1723361 RepID=UPI003D7FB3D9
MPKQCNAPVQEHNHEFEGSVILGNPPDSPELVHNHRFAGVTGPVIPTEDSHVHIISTTSDFFFNHFHDVEVVTGPVIPVRDQDGNVIGHVHGASGTTSCNFFHNHDFRVATLIQNPIGPRSMPYK